ncbi:TauD/TfdA family dioxygenase [Solwaraspora sp. WMMD1047]|uniref:TauD/TfdA family dioxygenase n=1 Tax=Solwaraspora sp. WMMD1047 TaxID=3016102 RepID=UPI002417B5D2|nr:TauD/TfdA family dioxygenase [Solwaraspora sp. WMMD1047]MDG4830659.1 TauD/TfdA family dioxygenase [Solwaraspora sp. WMMD1047]
MTSRTDEFAELRDLALTEDERSALSEVVAGLARTASAAVDDAAWQASARLRSCHLPTRLQEAIRAFRHDAGVDGRLTITNLPIGAETLPPTPTVPESVERTATTPATLAMLVGLQLGEVIAYREEKHGAMVQNVVPVPSLATSQSNGGSVQLEFHTENAFHPDRPHYVGLLCLRPAHEDRVGTQVASVRRAYPLLDEGSRTVLREARFVTATPPSFRSASESEPHPVLLGGEDDPDICVDFHATSALDDKADQALAALRAALTEVRCDLVLRPGDMVFLDNRLVVHGRVAFRPRYDGNDRWLHRVFVHLDNRRTRSRRTGNGAVLF